MERQISDLSWRDSLHINAPYSRVQLRIKVLKEIAEDKLVIIVDCPNELSLLRIRISVISHTLASKKNLVLLTNEALENCTVTVSLNVSCTILNKPNVSCNNGQKAEDHQQHFVEELK